jgi:hypothetical protein
MMVRKLTQDLVDLIIADKEHQKRYGFQNSHTLLGYNRAMLMIEEHGPEVIREALESEAKVNEGEEICQWCGADEERAIMHVVDNYDGSSSAYLCGDACLNDFMEEYTA